MNTIHIALAITVYKRFGNSYWQNSVRKYQSTDSMYASKSVDKRFSEYDRMSLIEQ